MSSLRLDAVLRTRVFQLTLSAAGAFVVLALVTLFLWARVMLWLSADAEEARLWELAELAEDLYYDAGTEALVEDLEREDGAIWPDDMIYEVLEEQGDLFVLRDADFDVVAGYPGLYGSEEIDITLLDHPEIARPVRAVMIPFRGGESVTVARFVPNRETDIRELSLLGGVLLVLIALPLALVTGYLLARSVFRRLAPITATAEAVATGDLCERAPDGGTGDEFDRLAAGINRMLDQIETLTRNIEGVTVGVAHDLKTPLGNIGGRLELIRRDAADPGAVAEHAETAEAHLQQLLRIFDALLRLGEIEAGARRAAFGPVDLSALAAEMAEAYGPIFEEADKSLRADIAPGVTVSGDRDLLAQLMANLLDNALEHSRDAARVSLSLSADGIEIADDGPGIPPSAAERVFERFFRGDASRTRPGNGLGLALVKAIADLHGAELSLRQGTPGAVFVVRFTHTKS